VEILPEPNPFRKLCTKLCHISGPCVARRALRRQLEMPVLVLHGEKDAALGVELLTGIEAAAPHSTVKVLKNCSHWWV